MAQVFISHAHSDEVLAGKLAAVIQDGLALSPADFFLSSQEGHGVEPAASIRGSIESELKSVPALVVLVTPRSATSPWVWLEAGSRLGNADKSGPLFVVPSSRFVSLVSPVSDLRCLQLDNEGEVHELLLAIGKSVGKPVVDLLNYKPALDDLTRYMAETYSAAAERRARTMSWLQGHALALVMLAAGLGTLAYGARLSRTPPTTTVEPPASSDREATMLQDLNDSMVAQASKFLVLKGKVTTAQGSVHDATVMVSLDGEVQDPATCEEPGCTKKTTTTAGEFTIDLTKIQARNGDSIVLSVVKPGFGFFSKEIVVDVRAMDAGTAPQTVVLSAAP